MRWLMVALLAFFPTLSVSAPAQIRGMAITPDQRMQLGTAAGSVRAGVPSGIHIGGFSNPTAVVPPGIHIGNTIAPPFGFRPREFHHHYFVPGTYSYALPYGYYGYGDYAPYGWDYEFDQPYTGYIGGTFTPYPGYPYPQQYAPPPNYYSPQSSPPPPAAQYQPRRSPQSSSSEQPNEPTVLVFRDGHREEIANYAIMGSTLFVLSGPRARIPIAELDIPATVRVNQDRGVEFHVPTKAQ
jgi:hypothetical protein